MPVTRVPASTAASGGRAWVARYSDPDGRRHAPTFHRKEEAQHFLQQVSYRSSRSAATGGVGFTAFLERFYAEVAPQVRPSTAKGYRRSVNHLRNWFGDTPLRDVTVVEIERFRSDICGRKSKAVASTALNFLRRCLALAVELQLIDAHPFDQLPPPPLPPVGRCRAVADERVFHLPDWGQVVALLTPGRGMLATVTHLGLLAGLRIGEILALRWCDVRWQAGEIDIESAATCHDPDDDPKTPGSRRLVPLTEQLLEFLFALAGNVERGDEGRVVVDDQGGTTAYEAVDRAFRKWQPTIGIGRCVVGPVRGRKRYVDVATLHEMRHAAVAIWIFAGVPDFAIAEWLGHAHLAFTLNKYGFLFDQKQAGLETWSDPRPLGAGEQGDFPPTFHAGGSPCATD